ncbi:dihydrolipoamide dehydrogenase [Lebetimonas natsushimae]|uniref:Dihydrolipoamide dehydrogenase n=1 Tax=Lebetimonas natsushimae TaxID=1936991 RepID=A0A292YDH5_9BACT|nr:NAD(P)/FAD-dependent oxidoreductase [Lebetimonas natsushimae]GAX87441.1 dihydrolipoamide dehydrogenase [Lebetimonas natsushimae]
MRDVICLGGGLNYAAAVVLAKAGKKVTLIEKDLNFLGGNCLHLGCIPSKNLLHRAKTVLESSEDVFTQKAKINVDKLLNKTFEKIKKNTNGVLMQLKAAGVEIIEGTGYVTDDGVEVNGETLQAKYIIIGTGSHPRIPEGIEVDNKKIITSKDVFSLTNLPKHIAIYGSGPIGLEFAGYFTALGSKVDLIYRHEHISKKIASEIVEKMEEQLKSIGVNLVANTSITKATVNKKVEMETNNGKLTADMLLVATGRIPNTWAIKTNKIKISKGIDTNDYFETSMQNVFAIGDVNAKLMLAHAARAQALNVANQILGKKEKLNLDNIPKFIYTMPLSYAAAGKMEGKKTIFTLNRLGISGAVLNSDNGMVILYTDEENFINGAEIFAPNAEEIIGIISAALAGEMDKDILQKAVFPHPTFSEAIDRVLRRVK